MENWQNFLESAVQRCYNSPLYEDFKKASNNHERTKLVMTENLTNVGWINHYLDEVKRSGLAEKFKKSAVSANKYRQEGNAAFKRSCDIDAMTAYNKCILFAPWPKDGLIDDSLALGLANRSAVLYHMKRYLDCLEDIDVALKCGYPKRLQHKVELRRAKCYFYLGKKDEVVKACQLTMEYINSVQGIEEKQIRNVRKDVEELLGKLDSIVLENVCEEKNWSDSIPELTYGSGSFIKNASSAVSLSRSEEEGRHFEANREIHPGDTLIVERPFAGVLLPDYYSSHCHHCFGLLIAVVYPCDTCARVRFCSMKCQEEALSKYHRTECRFLLLLHCVGVAHLSLRIILVAGLDYLIEFCDKVSKGLEVGLEMNGGVASLAGRGVYDTSYRSVYHLITHENDMETDDLLQYSVTSALLLRCLKESGYFDKTYPITSDLQNGPSSTEQLVQSVNNLGISSSTAGTDVEVVIGSLILRHICQIICNAHAITELQASEVDATKLVSEHSQVRIATAIYPTSSLCNHSCQPSFINSFHKDVLIVRAIKDILPGEGIFNCYGPQAGRTARTGRQQMLREQYFFTCKCQACEREEETEYRQQALRCLKCEGAVRWRSESDMKCTDCGEERTPGLTGAKAHSDLARETFIQGVVLMDQGNISGAIQLLKKCLQTQQRFLYRYNRDLAETNDALARCHASRGDFDSSAQHLRESVAITEQIYGKTSIELANELKKYSEVLVQCSNFSLAADMTKKAMDIFITHYGARHETVKELSVFLEYIVSM